MRFIHLLLSAICESSLPVIEILLRIKLQHLKSMKLQKFCIFSRKLMAKLTNSLAKLLTADPTIDVELFLAVRGGLHSTQASRTSFRTMEVDGRNQKLAYEIIRNCSVSI